MAHDRGLGSVIKFMFYLSPCDWCGDMKLFWSPVAVRRPRSRSTDHAHAQLGDRSSSNWFNVCSRCVWPACSKSGAGGVCKVWVAHHRSLAQIQFLLKVIQGRPANLTPRQATLAPFSQILRPFTSKAC